MKKLNYKFSYTPVYTYNELADQINNHTEVICLEGEILNELYKKLNDEINKNRKRLGFKILMGTLAVLSIMSLNPLLIAGAFSGAISSIVMSDSGKIKDYKENSVAIFRDSDDHKRLLLIYEELFDGPTDTIDGFENYIFFANIGQKFTCNCNFKLTKHNFDEETNRYYCPRCNHYIVRRIPLK
jgi:hypothetical protein